MSSSSIATLGDLPSGAPVPYGKYFLVRKLAEGGMAEIFLAKQVGAEGFERNVVIKRMLSNLSSSPDFVTMFLDEARLASRLNHPNVVQIHDLGQAEGCYYICMEYLAGEDFSTVLRAASKRREYVPMPIVLRVMIEAAHGLNFAHEFSDESGRPLNIVHRDISPSNIYVSYVGQVKVLDFGIAKAESRATQTTAGVVKGKYMYMAPEQARGLAVDRRADVFSLGVSLYEALTNTRPFARDADLAILNAVLTADFKPPRHLRPEIPQQLEQVVLKAMATNVEERYQSAVEMAADMERLLVGAPVNTGQVATYLRALFGEERITNKTRIPTLAGLNQQSAGAPQFVVTPSQPGSESGTRPLATPHSKPKGRLEATAVVNPPPGAVSPPAGTPATSPPANAAEQAANAAEQAAAPEPRKGGGSPKWLFPVVGLGLGALVAGTGILYGRMNVPAPAPVVVVAPQPAPVAVQPPAPAPAPSHPVQPAAAVEEKPAEPAPAASAEPVAAAAAPAEPKPENANPENANPEPANTEEPTRTSRPKRLVTLDAGDIQKVVSQGRGPILACFESFKDELPGDQGQVSVAFTILGSGKVSNAKVADAFGGTRVGKCLEQRVNKLRFPAHKDKEVSLSLPFAYRIQR
ncbi:MAG TPA: protein kinase [Myxococcaceae bacterium]|nr:protein kinase [Myxococcaceae bacterium]